MFPFSERAQVERWSHQDCQAFFQARVWTQRRYCNKNARRKTIMNIDIMMMVYLRSFLDQAVELEEEAEHPKHSGPV